MNLAANGSLPGAGVPEVAPRTPEVLPQQAPAVTASTAREYRTGTGTERDLPQLGWKFHE